MAYMIETGWKRVVASVNGTYGVHYMNCEELYRTYRI